MKLATYTEAVGNGKTPKTKLSGTKRKPCKEDGRDSHKTYLTKTRVCTNHFKGHESQSLSERKNKKLSKNFQVDKVVNVC